MSTPVALPGSARRWRARRPPPTAVTLGRRRGLWATALVAAGPALVALTYAWFADDLPAVFVVGAGAAQPVASWQAALACALIGLLLVAVAAAVARGAGRLGFWSQRLVLTLCAASSGLAAAVWEVLVSGSLGAGGPSPRTLLSGVVAQVLLLTLATAVVCGRPEPARTTLLPDPRLVRVDLPAAPAPWQVQFSTGFFTLGGCLLAMFGSTVFWSSEVVAAVAWACAGLSLLMGRMTLRIDEHGITLAPWGLPTPVTLSYDQVVEARPEVVHPLGWGGAAARVINARSGMWPRTGPGVTLVLADGRTLGLALDASEVAAGLINSHLDRARGGPYTGPLRRLEDVETGA